MVKKNYHKNSTKSNKIHPEFSDSRMTNYGGLVPFSDFLSEKLLFRNALDNQLDLGMARNCKYSDWQVFGLMILGYLSGHQRLAHFEGLSSDPVVQRLLGLDTPIDENTLGYRLKKAGYKQTVQFRRAGRQLAERVHAEHPIRLTGRRWIDVDSTVKCVFGNQEGAAKGFNPRHKGQVSYHPLIAFEAATKEAIHSWWRTGKAYSGNGAAEFFIELLQRLSGDYVIRADSGFFSNSFLSAIEAAGGDYLVKVKLKNLQSLLRRQAWQSIPGQPGTEYCEFTYKCQGWQSPRKFVGIRSLEKTITNGELFPRRIYSYSCYATTLREAPLEIHRCYRDRGECENWIDAVKNQLGAGRTLTEEFWANAMGWQAGVLAYNLSIWLRWLTDPDSHRQAPRTFREWFIHTAGKLTYHAGYYRLVMQASYLWRDRWEIIYLKTSQLHL